ncbi:voltage-dependent T-type calcium channel subunit alpha-1G-like isoform X2 [Frankliniella occidentalis]|uniref:Voltage-dependent T-type calcium channel subunit alpha-1G-like isoform X2 n=1 Tax=Frankliniella occidentalis TaxID=133901 RepID=A0A9C6UCC1_FRAOC|nr:voltage-dependent T-type calcium channel subunit alpha-1G-like isoform X2 [Frankliniella occidentalis]
MAMWVRCGRQVVMVTKVKALEAVWFQTIPPPPYSSVLKNSDSLQGVIFSRKHKCTFTENGQPPNNVRAVSLTLWLTWFERVSMLVILLNCITLGMYQPCVDEECQGNRCRILQLFDDLIFAFFSIEMTIKMIAMGTYGKGTYLADSWNRLDLFIVLAGALEYCLQVENLNLTAIRTIRVLRPLRAINRIPSMRILVMLLLDTLPMLGNVLLLCFFVFFIFGIVGVQLWEGILRQRCYLLLPEKVEYNKPLAIYYTYQQEQDRDYICSKPEDHGMHLCSMIPPITIKASENSTMTCTGAAVPNSDNSDNETWCVNWNQYYSECKSIGDNPFQGTISFDNIGMAWVAIFLVSTIHLLLVGIRFKFVLEDN